MEVAVAPWSQPAAGKRPLPLFTRRGPDLPRGDCRKFHRKIFTDAARNHPHPNMLWVPEFRTKPVGSGRNSRTQRILQTASGRCDPEGSRIAQTPKKEPQPRCHLAVALHMFAVQLRAIRARTHRARSPEALPGGRFPTSSSPPFGSFKGTPTGPRTRLLEGLPRRSAASVRSPHRDGRARPGPHRVADQNRCRPPTVRPHPPGPR